MRRSQDLIAADPRRADRLEGHADEVSNLRRRLVQWGQDHRVRVDPEYDPRLELAKLAHDITVPMPLRIDCHKALGEYLYPKIRNMELNVEGSGLTVRILKFSPNGTPTEATEITTGDPAKA